MAEVGWVRFARLPLRALAAVLGAWRAKFCKPLVRPPQVFAVRGLLRFAKDTWGQTQVLHCGAACAAWRMARAAVVAEAGARLVPGRGTRGQCPGGRHRLGTRCAQPLLWQPSARPGRGS